jgi:dienelactone hydrolase
MRCQPGSASLLSQKRLGGRLQCEYGNGKVTTMAGPIFKRVRKVLGGLTLLGLAAMLAAAVYLEVTSLSPLDLPRPTGSYSVGRSVFDWTDASRNEGFAGRADEKRELIAVMWYPTDRSGGPTAPYMPLNWERATQADQDWMADLLSRRLDRIGTHSYEDAPVCRRGGPFPLVVLQPGYGRASTDYTVIAENLASQGYVVLSSSPTYISDLVVFGDGRVARTAPQVALPETEAAISPDFMARTSRLVDVEQGDVAFLIAQAQRLNSERGSGFDGRIDLRRIGIVGHSLGGAVAYQFCKRGMGCKAAIDIDGTLFGDQNGVCRVPLLIVSADHSADTGDAVKEDAYNAAIFARQTEPAYRVVLRDTAHFNFSDLALRSPLFRYVGALGSADGRQSLATASAYMTDMLDTYLKGQKPQRIDRAAAPGVSVTSLHGTVERRQISVPRDEEAVSP